MLKIKIDGATVKLKTGDCKELAMAEMMFAMHYFYNTLEEGEKKQFKESVKESIDDILSDDKITEEDVNKACDKIDKACDKIESIEKIGELLGALEDAIKELCK